MRAWFRLRDTLPRLVMWPSTVWSSSSLLRFSVDPGLVDSKWITLLNGFQALGILHRS